MACVRVDHAKASIEPVTVYAMIAHCLSTLHNKTREGFDNRRHKIKAQNAAHSLIEHYTIQQSLHLLTIYNTLRHSLVPRPTRGTQKRAW